MSYNERESSEHQTHAKIRGFLAHTHGELSRSLALSSRGKERKTANALTSVKSRNYSRSGLIPKSIRENPRSRVHAFVSLALFLCLDATSSLFRIITVQSRTEGRRFSAIRILCDPAKERERRREDRSRDRNAGEEKRGRRKEERGRW